MEVNSVNTATPVEPQVNETNTPRSARNEEVEAPAESTSEAFEVTLSEEALQASRQPEETPEAETSTQPEVVQTYTNAGTIAG